MLQKCVKIFARLKPPCRENKHLKVSEDKKCVTVFHQQKNVEDSLMNNKKEQFKFSFEKILDGDVKQEDIFEAVGEPVIESVLKGYNGTIFAYGQTGSGKTYTMTGDMKYLDNRGIVMRTIEYLFQHFQKNPDIDYSVSVSYLEIYNEIGFDLLNNKGRSFKLEDFQRVHLMEDKGQNIHLKNLSNHPARNKEEAYSLLFNGDLNREMSDTPMNPSSTRSHCIFTIYITSKSLTSEIVRKSKLHLVDLAGSERVSKTGANGVILAEAKYINLSLHHLEQVIVALSEKNRQHVPYRNSLLTSVLRDSLGGNCMTVMIATCSSEISNLDETVSTCRFAQRVSQIHNEAVINEEVDEKMVMKQLKKENELLKMQLSINNLDSSLVNKELDEDEIHQCEEMVEKFIADGSVSSFVADPRRMIGCFNIFKKKLVSRDVKSREHHSGTNEFAECAKLNELLRQRDNEIEILVRELKKMKMEHTDGQRHQEQLRAYMQQIKNLDKKSMDETKSKSPSSRTSSPFSPFQSTLTESSKNVSLASIESSVKQDDFNTFKRKHKDYKLMKTLKSQLKQLARDAKQHGQEIVYQKNILGDLREKIEKLRVLRAARGKNEADSNEEELVVQYETTSQRHNEMIESLKAIKRKYDQFEQSVNNVKSMITADFEAQTKNLIENKRFHENDQRKSSAL